MIDLVHDLTSILAYNMQDIIGFHMFLNCKNSLTDIGQ